MLTDKGSKFLAILSDAWNFGCSTPIVVSVAELESQLLEYIRTAAVKTIMENVVVGWRDCALAN